ncbi:MAG TPA: hypothetical protein PKD17_03120 [Cellvibrionaceae bacterium]|nr:hypothetical protein [Cellvibrionaceae bacterium]HMW70781.1 hypothetical protein [Cellvibrionaceae bacterium]HMY38251.1 hypothetical protein [Marinagarivorans sp.]HNG60159.1 hypothetical protein [Cellvibrionaceae bacterium]
MSISRTLLTALHGRQIEGNLAKRRVDRGAAVVNTCIHHCEG